MNVLSLLCRVVLIICLVGVAACGDDGNDNDSGVLFGGGAGSTSGDTSDSTSGFFTGGGGETTPQETFLPVLGNGSHAMSGVDASLIAGSFDGLKDPHDLAFNPNSESDNELWIINQRNNSMTILLNAATEDQEPVTVSTISGEHFMVKPISLSFGDNGNLATIHETDEITQPSTPPDFMGPTLHSSKLDEFDGGHGGHLDMLHNSPLGMGIAWEEGNTYWVFDGYHSSVTRYQFNDDHGLGGADHTDGEVDRFIEGEVKREPGVLSKMVFDHSTSILYIADTGNSRILALDTTTGSTGSRITPNYDGTRQNKMDNASFTVVVDGASTGELTHPSGLAMRDGVLYVSDNATGRISGFDMDGNLIDYLDTGLPAGELSGITLDTEGNLFYLNGAQNRLWRIAPKAE